VSQFTISLLITGTLVCPAHSIWPWTVAWKRGNGNAPAGARYMMTMMAEKIDFEIGHFYNFHTSDW